MPAAIVELNGDRGDMLENISLDHVRIPFGGVSTDCLHSRVKLRVSSTLIMGLPGPLGSEL
jgi:hypothetical protein